MRKMLKFAIRFMAVCAASGAADSKAHDGMHDETATYASCASQLSSIPLDLDLRESGSGDFEVPSHSGGADSCADFNWAGGSFSRTLVVSPDSAFPAVTTSAGDCGHSTVEYGVYKRQEGSSEWSFAGGGMLFGKLVDGVCRHSASVVPQHGSVDSVALSTASWAEYRIGIRNWVHNDTNIGHTGTFCGQSSCYPPGHVRLRSCGSLRSGQSLVQGETVSSCDNRFQLKMQKDGNLVLYVGDEAMWASGTNGRGAQRAVMQPDGNLVVYTSSGQPLWSSNTHGNSDATVAIQEDGNLVVYAKDGRALWDSWTWGRFPPVGWGGCGTLSSDNPLASEQSFPSCDGRFRLKMQNDGNLVLYQSGRAVWASNTDGTRANRAVMQPDGNFVVYAGTSARWATGSDGNPGAKLVVQSDGNLVVYAGDGSVLWDSGTWGR